MRPGSSLMLLPLVAACATAPRGEGALAGLCAEIEPLMGQHAAALAGEAGDAAVVTGDRLIRGLDAACE